MKQMDTADNILAPEAAAVDVDNVVADCPSTMSKFTKAQLLRRLNESEKKRKIAKDKVDLTTKKHCVASDECKILAALAQEQQREGNLAHQEADHRISDAHAKIESRICQAACDVSATKTDAPDAIAASHKQVLAEHGYQC